MSCILRINGEFLDVDALLAAHRISSDRMWKKGEHRTVAGKTYTDSGAQFIASEADLDQFKVQVEQATKFLESHLSTIQSIVAFPGVESAVLDFGVELPEGYVAQFSLLPLELIRLAAQAGVAIELSHYLCSNEGGEG